MQTNLPQSLGYITTDEGPEVNISAGEPGGISKFGVSLTVLSEYRKAPVTFADVEALTQDDANEVYKARFAVPIQFDALPSGADYRLLDMAVSLGPTGAITALQMALRMWPVTGAMDAPTLAAVATADPKSLIESLSAAWITAKHATGGWPVNGHGWSNRNIRATDRAIAMIVGGS